MGCRVLAAAKGGALRSARGVLPMSLVPRAFLQVATRAGRVLALPSGPARRQQLLRSSGGWAERAQDPREQAKDLRECAKELLEDVQDQVAPKAALR